MISYSGPLHLFRGLLLPSGTIGNLHTTFSLKALRTFTVAYPAPPHLRRPPCGNLFSRFLLLLGRVHCLLALLCTCTPVCLPPLQPIPRATCHLTQVVDQLPGLISTWMAEVLSVLQALAYVTVILCRVHVHFSWGGYLSLTVLTLGRDNSAIECLQCP
jgi:hypothetical protein